LVPKGTSDTLADLLRTYAEASRLSWAAETDEDQARIGEDVGALLRQIAAHRSASVADIAAKLAVSAFELNGAGTYDHPGVTADDHLLIREDYARDHHAEAILNAAIVDVLRLSSR
jgi:hypothetical protein